MLIMIPLLLVIVVIGIAVWAGLSDERGRKDRERTGKPASRDGE